jgi:hypothetical protein
MPLAALATGPSHNAVLTYAGIRRWTARRAFRFAQDPLNPARYPITLNRVSRFTVVAGYWTDFSRHGTGKSTSSTGILIWLTSDG